MATDSLQPIDWQSMRSVVDCNRYMLENGIECDVQFTLLTEDSDNIQILAHKFVLISRSPVFFAMFSGPLAATNKTTDIRVTDIGADTFRKLLKYLYFEEVDVSPESVFPLLYAAKKYLVLSLAKLCIAYLDETLSAKTVCEYLENSFLFEEDDELKMRCSDVVRQESKQVFQSDGFYQMSSETLCRILKLESLSLHEIDVFKCCLLWAERQCTEQGLECTPQHKRQVLGNSLSYIHFPAMTLNDFTKVVVPSGLLTAEEENLVFRYMLEKDKKLNDVVESFPFPTRSRESVSSKLVVSYDGYLRHTNSYSSLFHGMPQRSKWSISLHVDHTIKLEEIGFVGKFKGSISVLQNGHRKLEITCHAHVQQVTLKDEDRVQLDPGLFSIACDSPFSYTGDYYTKGVTGRAVVPGLMENRDNSVNISVKECADMSFVSYLIVIPTDEMHFVDNHFEER